MPFSVYRQLRMEFGRWQPFLVKTITVMSLATAEAALAEDQRQRLSELAANEMVLVATGSFPGKFERLLLPRAGFDQGETLLMYLRESGVAIQALDSLESTDVLDNMVKTGTITMLPSELLSTQRLMPLLTSDSQLKVYRLTAQMGSTRVVLTEKGTPLPTGGRPPLPDTPTLPVETNGQVVLAVNGSLNEIKMVLFPPGNEAKAREALDRAGVTAEHFTPMDATLFKLLELPGMALLTMSQFFAEPTAQKMLALLKLEIFRLGDRVVFEEVALPPYD